MKMKIYIDVNENEIRRDPDWLATFLKGYLSQLAGYKVTDVDLLDDDENKIDNSSFSCSDCHELFTSEPHKCIHKLNNKKKGRGIPIPPEKLVDTWDEPKPGDMININDWEEEWIKKNITEEK